MENNSEKTLLSTTEAAELLGISRVAVFQKIKSGEIRARKVGRNYVIELKDLVGYAGAKLSDEQKEDIKQAVAQALQEYRDAFEMLGKE
jgi:excisionase family DNA binding protein